jgi:hypothetical protein
VGLRQLVRKTVCPAAMVAVTAGVMSWTLVVAPPSQASPIIAPIAAAVVEGGAEVAVGAAVAITPVGWVLIGGTLIAGAALLAYQNKDSWLPYVNGTAWGSGDASKPSGTPSGTAHVVAGLNLSNIALTDTHTLTSNLTWSAAAGSSLSASYGYVFQCQYATSSGIGDSNGNFTIQQIGDVRNLAAPVNVSMPFQCKANKGGVDYYGTPVALKIGLPGTDSLPSLPTDGSEPSGGPANEVMYGAFKTGQFNPNDPATKYTTNVECIDNFGTKSTISADSFGNQGGIKMPSCAAAGRGHGTGVSTVDGYAPGSNVPTRLYSTSFTPDPSKPLCDPGLSSGGCLLSVSIDGKPCTVGDIQCENWIKVDQGDSTHTRVSCNQGPYVAALSACFLLERAYYPGGAPANAANTDGDPATASNTDLNGNPMPAQQPSPVNVGTVPGGAGAPAPAPAPAPGASPNPGDCWPSGWGVLNPLEWVYDPIVCASKALFEPTKDVPTRITQMQGQFTNKIPITWFTAGTANVSGGACPVNWSFDIAGQHIPVICGTAADGIIRSFRPVMGAMLVLAAIWPLIRSLFYSVIPLLKVNPS